MSANVIETPAPPVTQNPPRKRWTRSECLVLESTGLIDQQRLELIEGELIDKMGKKRPHVDAHALLFAWLIQAFGARFVNSEAPIDVAPEDNPTNEPQPDLFVLRTEGSPTTPQAKDLRLVVEISDTTLAFDMTTKAALYARASIVEYWVLDIQGRRLIVHRDPQNGQYRSVTAYSETESIAPLAAPGSPFRVGDIFPQ